MKLLLPAPAPLDLGATLRIGAMWGGSPWQAVDATGGWYARHTPEGPATVQLQLDGAGVAAEAWGQGAEWLLRRVPELLGFHDDPQGSWTPQHELLAVLKKRFAGVRLGRTGDIYPRLVAAALAQKVTGKNGEDAVRRIARKWGQPAPGPRPDLSLLPKPGVLAAIPYEAFHPLNVERHRAVLVKSIAERATALQRAADLPPEEARAHLMKLRGIGPWTAAVVAGQALGDPDAVPVGDYNLPHLVAWNLAREPRATDERMLELLAPYAGQRGRVVRLLKVGGSKAPRYGPRVPVHDIRGY